MHNCSFTCILLLRYHHYLICVWLNFRSPRELDQEIAVRKNDCANKKRRRIKKDRVKSEKDPTSVQRYRKQLLNEHGQKWWFFIQRIEFLLNVWKYHTKIIQGRNKFIKTSTNLQIVWLEDSLKTPIRLSFGEVLHHKILTKDLFSFRSSMT